MKTKVIHLPNNMWCIESNGIRCTANNYPERIIAQIGNNLFAGQTEYWGEEKVWLIKEEIPHTSIDESLPEPIKFK